jgi:hypothetical protein
MTNTPEQCDETKFWHIFNTNNCAELLKEYDVEPFGMEAHNPPKNGIKEFRSETRKSKDQTCELLVDIYISVAGTRQEFPVILTINNRDYLHPYVPRPI